MATSDVDITAACLGGLVAQVNWLDPKAGGC